MEIRNSRLHTLYIAKNFTLITTAFCTNGIETYSEEIGSFQMYHFYQPRAEQDWTDSKIQIQ